MKMEMPLSTRGYKACELRINITDYDDQCCSEGLKLITTPNCNTQLEDKETSLTINAKSTVSKNGNLSRTTRLLSSSHQLSTLLSFPPWEYRHGWLAILRRLLSQNECKETDNQEKAYCDILWTIRNLHLNLWSYAIHLLFVCCFLYAILIFDN
jgi:hypothetical protein